MAYRLSAANGNWTTAGTWGQGDSTALVSTSASTTALTTSDQDSAAFIPGAITIDGIALKLGYVAATPAATNTLTITLRNSTDSTNLVTLSYDVSALPNFGSGYNPHGWIFFKFDTTYTTTAAKNYIIRLKLSATASQPAVHFCTNGTAANWQHILRSTTTGAPAAGDDIYILNEVTPTASSVTSRTVTMDNTAATDFGNNGTNNAATPALCLGWGSTLTWASAAATNYQLVLSGALTMFYGSTMNMGTVATPCPRDSTMTLTFDSKSYSFYGYAVASGSKAILNCQGQSRTAGNTTYQTYISGNHAAGATTLNVEDDTGWLNGDSIWLGPQLTTNSGEVKALTGNMGASSGSITALTNEHNSAAPRKVRCWNLTRNVTIKNLEASNTIGTLQFAGTIDCDWMAWWGWTSTNAVVAGAIQEWDYCAFYKSGGANPFGFPYSPSNAGGWHFRHCVMAHIGSGTVYTIDGVMTSTDWTLHHFYSGATTANGPSLPALNSATAVTNLYHAGGAGGITVNGATVNTVYTWSTMSDWEVHTTGGIGIVFYGQIRNQWNWTVTNFTTWWNTTYGLVFSASNGNSWYNLTIDNLVSFGNGTAGLSFDTGRVEAKILGGTLSDYTGASRQNAAIDFRAGGYGGTCHDSYLQIFGTNLGVATGDFVANTDGLFRYGSGTTDGARTQIVQRGGGWQSTGSVFTYNSTDWPASIGGAVDSFAAISHNNADDVHKKVWVVRGTVEYEASVFRTAAPAIKMTPASASYKLESGDKHVPLVDGAAAKTVSVYVRRTAAYNGAQPRLRIRRNDAIGQTSDATLATAAIVADDTWTLVTASLPVATDDGVAEVYVDCDGTAGSIYVDDWSVS